MCVYIYIYRHCTYRCICIHVGGVEEYRRVEELGRAEADGDGEVGGGGDGGRRDGQRRRLIIFVLLPPELAASSSRPRFSRRAIFQSGLRATAQNRPPSRSPEPSISPSSRTIPAILIPPAVN